MKGKWGAIFRVETRFHSFENGCEKGGEAQPAIAYTTATMQGKKVQQMGLQKYIGRVKEVRRTERRHSSFYIGLYGQTWVNFMNECIDTVSQLMRFKRNKSKYYQKGLRAMELVLATL